MLKDWEDLEVVRAWTTTCGAFGDYWRMSLVNPLVLRLALSVKAEDGGAIPLHAGLAAQRVSLNSGSEDELREWHKRSSSSDEALDGIQILDLGCGEGYLGRWLRCKGASYVGVDASSKLIQSARQLVKPRSRGSQGRSRNASPLPECQFLEADLDGPKFQLDLAVRPDLVIGNILLDHLASPGAVLDYVSQLLVGDSKTRYALFVTLNPDYFELQETEDDLGALESSWRSDERKAQVTISSCGMNVSVYFRSQRLLESLLRDARLQVIDCAPLGFAMASTVPQEPAAIRGVPAFLAYLVKSYGERRPSDADLPRLINGDIGASVLNALSDSERDVLLSHKQAIDVTAFDPNADVLAQHNLGGDLFVVVRGSLALIIKQRTVMTFSPGEAFGELEAGEGVQASYYPFPVRAGAGGAEVLRIPQRVVQEMVGSHRCLNALLLDQLRQRLIVDLWSYSPRERSGAKVEVSGAEFGLTDMTIRVPMKRRDHADRVARILLSASDHERLAGTRGRDGRQVLIGFDELCVRSEQLVSDSTPVQEVIRILIQIGVVDALPGRNVRDAWPDLYSDSWNRVVRAATDQLLAPVDRVPQGLLGRLELEPSNRWKGNGDRLTNDIRGLRRDLLSKNPTSELWCSAVDRWLCFLYRVNVFWYETSPSFYNLLDVRLLRALALDDDESVNRLLASRWCSKTLGNQVLKNPPGYVTLKDRIAQHQPGRMGLYVRRAEMFFVDDLRLCAGEANRQLLRFSGGSGAYATPESWDS